MTRRPVETVSPTHIKSTFTDFRHLELAVEDGRAISAWSTGTMIVGAKPVLFGVLVDQLADPSHITRILGRAKVLIQEAVTRGQNAMPLLAEGTTIGGTKAFMYRAASVDAALAEKWLTSFTLRNRIELADAEAEQHAPKVNKSKAKPGVGVPAASV